MITAEHSHFAKDTHTHNCNLKEKEPFHLRLRNAPLLLGKKVRHLEPRPLVVIRGFQ